MPFRLKILAGISWIVAVGCSTNFRSSFPCHDGWTTDNSGKSQAWIPSPEDVEKLSVFYSDSDIAVCYHKMPSGLVTILLKANADRKFVSLMPSGDTYEMVESGFLITVH